MNRLFLCCMLSCTVTTCTAHTIQQQVSTQASNQTGKDTQPTQQIEQTKNSVQESPRISRENIAQKVTEYIASLCEQKDYSFNEIPENLLVEKQTKTDFIIKELTSTMLHEDRTFVYQHEIETITKKTIDRFLSHVRRILRNRLGTELIKHLEITPLTKQSSKMVLPADVRAKLNQSKLLKTR